MRSLFNVFRRINPQKTERIITAKKYTDSLKKRKITGDYEVALDHRKNQDHFFVMKQAWILTEIKVHGRGTA